MLGRLEGGMSTPHSHPVILVCLLSECLTNCRRATARLYEVFRATDKYIYVCIQEITVLWSEVFVREFYAILALLYVITAIGVQIIMVVYCS